jgi:hypothetical protein
MKDKIINLSIGESIDWKFGLITREVYRISKNKFEINETCGIWITAIVTKKQMNDLFNGSLSIRELKWN